MSLALLIVGGLLWATLVAYAVITILQDRSDAGGGGSLAGFGDDAKPAAPANTDPYELEHRQAQVMRALGRFYGE